MEFVFDPKQYGTRVAEAIGEGRLNELGPGRPNAAAGPMLSSLSAEVIFDGKAVHDLMAAQCCLSGLWLYHDYLDESHTISQSIPTTDGSYWHGIMHRREPDASNSKYWFRKVGRHEAFAPLLQQATSLLSQQPEVSELAYLVQGAEWDAFAFVDACDSAYRRGTGAERVCQKIQQIEWQLLFDFCFQKAIGK
ncbi:MAG: hypothetical protein P9L94_13575 [Candidatus Hinthialibacter antarcticus]|nr:hypothetical protein [Candidatus Hinthialibacter antarcticus]